MVNHFKTIDEYIATFPKDIQKLLTQVRKIIKNSAPGATEVIKYQIPTFQLNGKNLVHFAAFAKHIGFYPTPGGIVKFKAKLTSYTVTKGTIQFPIDKPIPFDLIKQITEFRVTESLPKKK